jgi:hypothetical protein
MDARTMIAVMTVIALTAGCDSPPHHRSKAPKVTTSGTASISIRPSERLPQSPSCHLLDPAEVRSALGLNEIATIFGSVSHTTGASGLPIKDDTCTFQEDENAKGTLLQVKVDGLVSATDALKEYRAMVALLDEHQTPGELRAPVRGLGQEATLLSEWVVARRKGMILSLSIKGFDAAGKTEAVVLRDLAQRAAERLGW